MQITGKDILNDAKYERLDDCLINLLGLRSDIEVLPPNIQKQILYRAISDLSAFLGGVHE